MDPEHQEPDLTDKADVDPSINATNLVVQEGENMGAVNAFDTEPGIALEDNGEKKDIPDSEQPYTAEGLPVIGADAEEASTEATPAKTRLGLRIKVGQEYRQSLANGVSEAEAREAMHDNAGTEAMATAVRERAMALMPEEASDALKKEYGELAATKFKEMLESKLAERKKAANAEVQAMIDKLKGSDSLPEAVSVEDLTEIGNEAKQASRDSHPINPPEVVEKLRQEYQQSLANGVPEAEAREAMHDKAGTEAKAAEVKKRAMDLTTKAADEALREEYGELAATKFKEGLESELAEKKDAANAKAQEMIDVLRALGAGKLPLELTPSPVTDDGKWDKPDGIWPKQSS